MSQYRFARLCAALILGLSAACGGPVGIAQAGSCNPDSEEPNGFFLGQFPSSTNTGILVCARPADARCMSCGYAMGGPGGSNCDNPECTTATCICGGSVPYNDRIFWDSFNHYF